MLTRMRMVPNKKFGSALLLITVCPMVLAETQTVLLDPMVVTGTRSERSLSDSPVRTEVITREELERSHARDLSEALKAQPGIQIKSIHGKNGTGVWLQGLDPDRVLVLIDGRPVSASTGSAVDLSQLAVANIAQIEVVKGAVSAMHGSSAMGGVVNIITEKPDAPFAASVTLDAGSYGDKDLAGSFEPANRRHLLADVSGRGESWFYGLTLDRRDSDGFDLDKSSYAAEGAEGPRTNIEAQFGQQFESGAEWRFAPSYYREDSTRGFSTFTPGVGDILKADNEDATRKNANLSFVLPTDAAGKFSGYFMRETFKDITQQDVLSTEGIDQQRTAELAFDKAELQWDRALGREHVLTIGAVWHEDTLEQNQERLENGLIQQVVEIEPGARLEATELFIQDDWFVSESFELLPGVRYQSDSDFGDHLSPKLNGMWTLPGSRDARLRFGLGEGYRVPNLKERYYLFDHSALGYVVLGNPDLQPESSTSAQLGLNWPADNNVYDLSLYYNRIRDLIQTDLNAERSAELSLGVYEYTNVARAETYGSEMSWQRQWQADLATTLAYHWLHAEDLDSGNTLVKRPEHEVSLKLDWTLPRFDSTSLHLTGRWQSKEYVDSENSIVSPAWHSLDLKLNHDLSDAWRVFAGVDNLTDQHRKPDSEGQDFRPKEGRFLYIGARWRYQ